MDINKSSNKFYICNVAEEGAFFGPVVFLEDEQEIKKEQAVSKEEIEKLDAAALSLKGKIDVVDIILNDETFINKIRECINKENCNAQYAIKTVTESYSESLSNSSSEYLRGRSEDVRGIGKKLIEIISNKNTEIKESSVVAAHEISPADLAMLDQSKIGGLVTYNGSKNSHVSIWAGNLGIPYVYGNKELIKELRLAKCAVIDGEKVTINPDQQYQKEVLERINRAEKEDYVNLNALKLKTKICANIAGPDDLDKLIKAPADGVGLFRSEFLFINKTTAPNEEEQFDAYKKVLDGMAGKEVIIRTMDIGSDKMVPWLNVPKEANPALGLRGVRVSLENKEVFATQLRALLRASVFGNLKVMFPMIASVSEIDEIWERIKEAEASLKNEEINYKMPEFGVMIETPAAVLVAEEIALHPMIKFFSIGTNDLSQYTLAIDREAVGLDKYFDAHHPAIIRLIEMTIKAGHKFGVSTGICGQLAADKKMIKTFIDMGVDELSVPIAKVGEVKREAARVYETREAAKVAGNGEAAKTGGSIGFTKIVENGEAEKASGSSGIAKIVENGEAAKTSENSGDAKTGENRITIGAIADGKLIPMKDIPDPAFASGKLGRCVGIVPENGKIIAPCDAVVGSIASTKHALSLSLKDGSTLLLHAGIDTVKLDGKGFEILVNKGQEVKNGEPLMNMDLDLIKEAGLSTMIILAYVES